MYDTKFQKVQLLTIEYTTLLDKLMKLSKQKLIRQKINEFEKKANKVCEQLRDMGYDNLTSLYLKNISEMIETINKIPK